MGREMGQLDQLARNVEELAGAQVRAQVMQGREQLSGAKAPDVAQWVQGAMERLDAAVDEPTRGQIMARCGHNCAQVNRTPVKRAVARRAKFATLHEFLAAEQRKPPAGTRLEREGDILYQFYTPRAFTHPMRCYCGLLRGLPDDQTVSATFCQCSRGFVEEYWQAILQRPVQVDLLESCVSGAAECKFAIHLQAEQGPELGRGTTPGAQQRR